MNGPGLKESVPRPVIDQMRGLLGEYMDARHIEVLEDDILVSEPYEVLFYSLNEVAKGEDFLNRPAVSYWRFFILVERKDQLPEKFDLVGLVDCNLVGDVSVPVHWQRGRIVQELFSSVQSVASDESEGYVRFVEVDPLHFSGIWLSDSPGGDRIIPMGDFGGLSFFSEVPAQDVATKLVGIAKERESREREYYRLAYEEAFEKLRSAEAKKYEEKEEKS